MSDNNQFNTTNNNINFSSGSSSSNIWQPPSDELDELFAVLGYNVKPSDMADVAQKIQYLEEVMGQSDIGSNTSDLASDTAHYNPSDMSSWLESMLSGYDQPTPDPFPTNNNSSSSSHIDFGSDLISIPGEAIYPSNDPPQKKLKSLAIADDNLPAQPVSPNQARPVVLVDSQDNGVILVHTLMACAEAVQKQNLQLAEALMTNIGRLAVTQPGAMRKVATYFGEALGRRILGLYPANYLESNFIDMLQMHFYETCPYLKFAHFTANQAILEAFAGKTRVHVIDFSIKQGMQWPALLQALALRPGGPPSFRLTGIGPPAHDNTDHLQEVGWKLARFAETINVEFEYRGYVANSLSDLRSVMFNIREGETVAVNSVFELHTMLARPGAVERVLNLVTELKPAIFTVVEQEANHNGSVFMDRFTESLHYYSTLFDSLESCNGGGGNGAVNENDKAMSEMYLGRQICNVVAAEGPERVERHETLAQWRTRFASARFEPVHLGSIAYKQASTLLALFAGGGGYRVEENNGCLMLGWHTRPLIATSAWKPA